MVTKASTVVDTDMVMSTVLVVRGHRVLHFMYQLTVEESASLRIQIGTLKSGRGGHRKYLPYVFTEQGAAMLSSVLRSERAVNVNIEIMRAFVRLRQAVSANKELARKLTALEDKYDRQFKVVFDAIRGLMDEPEANSRGIGFTAKLSD
jgi:ORF6N domain